MGGDADRSEPTGEDEVGGGVVGGLLQDLTLVAAASDKLLLMASQPLQLPPDNEVESEIDEDELANLYEAYQAQEPMITLLQRIA